MTKPGTIGTDEGTGANASGGRGPDGSPDTRLTQCAYRQGPPYGAGAVRDIYTLLRKGMRRLLRELGYHLRGQRRGLSEKMRQLIETYVDQDRKADTDGRNPEAGAESLKVLADGVQGTLTLATEHTDNPSRPQESRRRFIDLPQVLHPLRKPRANRT